MHSVDISDEAFGIPGENSYENLQYFETLVYRNPIKSLYALNGNPVPHRSRHVIRKWLTKSEYNYEVLDIFGKLHFNDILLLHYTISND